MCRNLLLFQIFRMPPHNKVLNGLNNRSYSQIFIVSLYTIKKRFRKYIKNKKQQLRQLMTRGSSSMFYMSSISGYPFLFSFLLYTFADVLLFIPNQKCSHDCLLYSCVWGQLQQLCRSSVFMAWSLCLL